MNCTPSCPPSREYSCLPEKTCDDYSDQKLVTDDKIHDKTLRLTCNCPEGRVLKEGQCVSPQDECIEPKICSYVHQYTLNEDGFQIQLPPRDQHTKRYKVGDVWTDGNCRHCLCEQQDDKVVPVCRETTCPSIHEHPDRDDYEIVAESVPHQCCSTIRRKMCKVNGRNYEAGNVWPSPDGDKCVTYECSSHLGEVVKVQRIQKCNKTCQPFEVYKEPSPESSECCGHCEARGCEEDGILYKAGARWNSTSKKCYEGECLEENGKFLSQYTRKKCPAICPEEDVVDDETGCCKISRRPNSGGCASKIVPLERTKKYFEVNTRDHGICYNNDTVPGLRECTGKCETQTEMHYIEVLGKVHKTINCHCCSPTRTKGLSVQLFCHEDGFKLTVDYDVPLECKCNSCSEVDNSFDINGDAYQ